MIKVIKKVVNVTLDLAVGAWLIFLIAVLVMLVTGCGSSYQCPSYM